MSTLQQVSVQCSNSINSKKKVNTFTDKRRSVSTVPTSGNKLLERKQTVHDHEDVDICAEAFIQNFRRQLLLQCDNILPT
ncbi:unnamed protein product [Cochlearia groenlandica]